MGKFVSPHSNSFLKQQQSAATPNTDIFHTVTVATLGFELLKCNLVT